MEDPHERISCDVMPEQQHFVYIKVHKCRSDTLSAIFRRFAYLRNLSVALPIGGKFNLGWPHPLKLNYYRPSKSGHYDALFDHSLYTKEQMTAMMPDDTVFMASLRVPFAHLKSAMAYMMIRQWSGITEPPPEGLEIFLHNMKHYMTFMFVKIVVQKMELCAI